MPYKYFLLCLLVTGCYFSYAQQHKKSTHTHSKAHALSSRTHKCNIDTEAILSNRYLPELMAQLEKDDLHICRRVNCIPAFIMKFMNCITEPDDDGRRFVIANPGEDWQVTDVIMDKKQATRQLVFFAMGKKTALMVHFTGGIGKAGHILIFQLQNQQIINFWAGIILEDDIANTGQIIQFLKANKDKEERLNTNLVYF